MQESSRDINFFGLDPTHRMTSVQKTADAYLKARQYRQRSLKDLSYLFALSNDEDEKTSSAKPCCVSRPNYPMNMKSRKRMTTPAFGDGGGLVKILET